MLPPLAPLFLLTCTADDVISNSRLTRLPSSLLPSSGGKDGGRVAAYSIPDELWDPSFHARLLGALTLNCACSEPSVTPMRDYLVNVRARMQTLGGEDKAEWEDTFEGSLRPLLLAEIVKSILSPLFVEQESDDDTEDEDDDEDDCTEDGGADADANADADADADAEIVNSTLSPGADGSNWASIKGMSHLELINAAMDRMQGPTGTALFARIRFANHSCEPNAYIDFCSNAAAQLITTKPLKDGDEVFISYVDEEMSQPERAKELAGYGFVCECARCKQEQKSSSDAAAPKAEAVVAADPGDIDDALPPAKRAKHFSA